VGDIEWGENVHNIHPKDLLTMTFDSIIYQSPENYTYDQFEILTDTQRQIAKKIYIEHNPPQESPTNTKHFVDDPDVLLVHVTHYNNLMWDNNRTPTRVIEHGVTVPEGVEYSGEIPRGIFVINDLPKRGRRLGLDIFEKVRKEVPVDVVGMGNESIGGIDAISLPKLPAFCAKYRFSLNPIRYTSLGLGICETMMVGLPIVGLATTELPMKIQNGITGFIDTDINVLIEKMKLLIEDEKLAKHMGEKAKAYATETFSIQRFTREWEDTIAKGIITV
jgi:glycosyltransferase involved in cell wall biosynthesis